jgi:hypothetical protein
MTIGRWPVRETRRCRVAAISILKCYEDDRVAQGHELVSSAEYYRLLNEQVRDQLGEYRSARCVMCSVDFADIEILQSGDRWADAATVLGDAAPGGHDRARDCRKWTDEGRAAGHRLPDGAGLLPGSACAPRVRGDRPGCGRPRRGALEEN